MTVSELLDLLCEALEIGPGRLKEITLIGAVPEWTSIGWLSIMGVVDEHLGVQITPKSIREFQTVGDLVRHIASKTSVVR